MRTLLLTTLMVLAAAVFARPAAAAEDTVKIGVLHSLSGTMAISETSLRDVVLMAAEEINEKGGVLGKKIEPVVVDPASDWPLFAEKAKELITQHKVASIFGCWTSVSRKSVLPVIEEYNALLFYPVQYEGEEQSLNVFYTAASPNQQLVPAADYAIKELGCKKFYLLGTDYVFPRTANKVLKAFLLKSGVPEANIMEEYTPFHHQDYQTIVGKIKKFAASGDACVLSTINGDSNVPFYTEFANQGLTADDCPIVAFSVSEDELRAMDTSKLVGHFLCLELISKASRARPTRSSWQISRLSVKRTSCPVARTASPTDPIEAAYYGVYVWAAAAEKAGPSRSIRSSGCLWPQFDAPGGKKKMHESNQHTYKPVYMGEIRADGQFDIVWESDGLVEPDSYSKLLWAGKEPRFPPPVVPRSRLELPDYG